MGRDAYRNEADSPMSILIVEDDPFVASTIREVLGELGFAVTGIASSGSEALWLVDQCPPSPAPVDIRLVGPMDGIEVAQALRSRHHVPVIFLSGFVDLATIERARAAQPLDLLVKPFRPSQVFNTIEAAYEH
jgi:CheY-like chemotaxis protein